MTSWPKLQKCCCCNRPLISFTVIQHLKSVSPPADLKICLSLSSHPSQRTAVGLDSVTMDSTEMSRSIIQSPVHSLCSTIIHKEVGWSQGACPEHHSYQHLAFHRRTALSAWNLPELHVAMRLLSLTEAWSLLRFGLCCSPSCYAGWPWITTVLRSIIKASR